MMRIYFYFNLIIISACSPKQADVYPNSQPAFTASGIIGGKEVNIGAISQFTVGLYDKKNRFICTGSLIREDIVLTAAHCIESSSADLVVVFGLDFSALDKKNSDLLRNVSTVKIHSDFMKNATSDLDWNDIALVKFNGGLPKGYQPVSLLTDRNILAANTPVQMAGYGASSVDLEEDTAKNNKKFKQELAAGEILCYDKNQTQCYRITYLGADRLRLAEAKIEGFTEKEIRINESKGQGTCVGDSGGPLVYRLEDKVFLVGVTSRGSLFCDSSAIYTNAVEYLSWIQAGLSELTP